MHLNIFLQSVNLSLLASSEAALNTLLHTKTISMRVKIQNSDKLYREQTSMLELIQKKSCNFYVNQILLDNQYDNLSEIDLYDSVQEDAKALIKTFNFNKIQLEAVQLLHYL